MLEVALSYLARGWSVVPGHTIGDDGLCTCRQPDCDRPGKHPRVKWAEFQDRLPTEGEVKWWWNRWPDSNPIIITGRLSGIVAVDIDPRHGGDEAWRVWTQTHPIADTVTSITGSGGQHLIFKHPGAQELRNTINMLSPGSVEDPATGRRRKLEGGVDFRGDGGYIVAPPSRHISGSTYEWDSSLHPDDTPVMPMPPSLVMLVMRAASGAGPNDETQRGALDIEAYLVRHEPIGEGERNATMTRICGFLANSIDNRIAMEAMVESVNEQCCQPPIEPRELKRIMDSIWRREQAQRAARDRNRQNVEMNTVVESLGPEATQIEIAEAIWMSLGVPRVTDWIVMLGDRTEYVLTTPEDEVRIVDLLDNEGLRRTFLNRLGVMLPQWKRGSFDTTAQKLRQVAREVIVDERHAEDRLAEWIDAYTKRHGLGEIAHDQREAALQQGPIWIGETMYLRPNRFANFIYLVFGEELSLREVRSLLKRAGWTQDNELRAWKSTLRADEGAIA